VAGTLTVTLSPITVTQTSSSNPVTSSTVTSSVSGGSGVYTYEWTDLSGSLISIGSYNYPDTNFSISLAPGDDASGTFRCTATDYFNPSLVGYKNIYVTLIRT